MTNKTKQRIQPAELKERVATLTRRLKWRIRDAIELVWPACPICERLVLRAQGMLYVPTSEYGCCWDAKQPAHSRCITLLRREAEGRVQPVVRVHHAAGTLAAFEDRSELVRELNQELVTAEAGSDVTMTLRKLKEAMRERHELALTLKRGQARVTMRDQYGHEWTALENDSEEYCPACGAPAVQEWGR